MARRRRHRRSHARRSSKSCNVTTIRFKTKRGKTVSFRGRPGGMTTAGGKCAPKRRKTSHLSKWKSAMRRAAKACRGKSGFRRCVGSKIRAA